MTDKIVGLDTAPDELKGSIEKLRRILPDLIEHTKLVAKVKRAAYAAYIEEGFTPQEALELCKGSVML